MYSPNCTKKLETLEMSYITSQNTIRIPNDSDHMHNSWGLDQSAQNILTSNKNNKTCLKLSPNTCLQETKIYLKECRVNSHRKNC